MARYRFAVEYDGTPFAGWQIQPNAPTVEGELERALSLCLRAPVDIVGAGRTDAGVHAAGQVAHFDHAGALDTGKVERSLNALTCRHVAVRRLEACAEGFHARYHALSRRYRYLITLRPSPLLGDRAWHCPQARALDPRRFAEELAAVLGKRDFANFCLPNEQVKGTECHVTEASLEARGHVLEVWLEANRFLHRMVRAIVGACADVARGYRPPGLVRAALEGPAPCGWTWAPPQGLCLERVCYPDYEY